MPANWPHYNFTGMIDTCVEHQVATMNIRVLAAGILATEQRHGREMPLTAGDTVASETLKAAAMFKQLDNIYGTRAQTALRFALGQDRLSCIVVGLAEIDHLQEALGGAELGPLPHEALEKINQVYEGF